MRPEDKQKHIKHYATYEVLHRNQNKYHIRSQQYAHNNKLKHFSRQGTTRTGTTLVSQ